MAAFAALLPEQANQNQTTSLTINLTTKMNAEEIKTQLDHDEAMRRLRERFACEIWPAIVARLGKEAAGLPAVHQAAWLGVMAGMKSRELT